MSDRNRPASPPRAAGDKDRPSDAAARVGAQAQQAGAQAAGQVREAVKEAKSQGAEMLGAAKNEAMSRAEQGKSELADRLEDVAEAAHRSGAEFEGHQDAIAHLVERGAAELEALSRTLRGNNLQELLNELGGLARRQPALFVGASMAAGFALARVGRVAVAQRADEHGSNTQHSETQFRAGETRTQPGTVSPGSRPTAAEYNRTSTPAPSMGPGVARAGGDVL